MCGDFAFVWRLDLGVSRREILLSILELLHREPVGGIHVGGTLQRYIAAIHCSDTLQRYIAAIHCDDTLR